MIPHSTRYSYRMLLTIVACSAAPQRRARKTRRKCARSSARLERLEKDNEALTDELRALRKELAVCTRPRAGREPNTDQPPARSTTCRDETQAVDRARIDELNQTKVESSQKFPIRITGMALFNAYLNGASTTAARIILRPPLWPQAIPPAAPRSLKPRSGCCTMARRFSTAEKSAAPCTWISSAGSTDSIGHLLRIRTASVNLDWTNTSIMFGQDKPIISPRDPDSLAQVGFSPLTGAGNPWLWQPQIRMEQRFSLSNDNGLRVQAGVFQTTNPSLTPTSASLINRRNSRCPARKAGLNCGDAGAKPAAWRSPAEFTTTATTWLASRFPSNVYSVDWFFRPIRKIEFSGMFFHGRNVPVLGALPPGFSYVAGRADRSRCEAMADGPR